MGRFPPRGHAPYAVANQLDEVAGRLDHHERRPGVPADGAQLAVGDVILSVDEEPVKISRIFGAIYDESAVARKTNELPLEVQRGGGKRPTPILEVKSLRRRPPSPAE